MVGTESATERTNNLTIENRGTQSVGDKMQTYYGDSRFFRGNEINSGMSIAPSQGDELTRTNYNAMGNN